MTSMSVVLVIALHISIILVYAQNSSSALPSSAAPTSSVAPVSTSSVDQNTSSDSKRATRRQSAPTRNSSTTRARNSTPGTSSQTCKKVNAKHHYDKFWDRNKMKDKREDFEKFFIVEISVTVIGGIFTIVAIVVTSKEGVAELEVGRETTAMTTIEEKQTMNAIEEEE